MRLLREFVRDPGGIGTVIPSSRQLAKAMTSDIGIETAKTVVEVGPGSGVFTARILELISPETKFFLVELNPRMHKHLTEKFPDVKIYNESVENLSELMKRENMASADVVVSGLPWASFPSELQHKLLDAIYSALSKGGMFTTYGYIQGKILPGGLNIRKLLKKHFDTVESSETIWQNLPPAFVYKCVK
ncbi:MAG: methyltransferase domain-containing protein [Lentisphaerae bacterium]|nr:methyltransferase domain-containing protein [Lentisphaerota bacterium]